MARQSDPVQKTRASLLRRLGQSPVDQGSWQEFFDIYWKLIYGVARQTGLTDDEAQDVVQETLASVAKAMPGFKYDPAIGSFKAWLAIKTRWCAISHYRKRIPVADSAGDRDPDASAEGTVERIVDPSSQDFDRLWELEWMKTLLAAATATVQRKVGPRKYEMFDLNVNQGWKAEEVAERFAISVENLYVIISRIKAQLKEEVSRLDREAI